MFITGSEFENRSTATLIYNNVAATIATKSSWSHETGLKISPYFSVDLSSIF